jgi:hypothetical protein
LNISTHAYYLRSRLAGEDLKSTCVSFLQQLGAGIIRGWKDISARGTTGRDMRSHSDFPLKCFISVNEKNTWNFLLQVASPTSAEITEYFGEGLFDSDGVETHITCVTRDMDISGTVLLTRLL